MTIRRRVTLWYSAVMLISFLLLGGGMYYELVYERQSADRKHVPEDSVEEELGEGIPHEDVYLYEDALRHGHTVLIAYADEGDQSDNASEVMRKAGAEDLDELRENWWEELREGERTNYTGDFDSDEESYRRGYTAALHPQRRERAYSDVEDELRTQYANTVLDRPFQSGYERGLNHRSRGVE